MMMMILLDKDIFTNASSNNPYNNNNNNYNYNNYNNYNNREVPPYRKENDSSKRQKNSSGIHGPQPMANQPPPSSSSNNPMYSTFPTTNQQWNNPQNQMPPPDEDWRRRRRQASMEQQQSSQSSENWASKPPPPPPPQSSNSISSPNNHQYRSSYSTPIHYHFPAASSSTASSSNETKIDNKNEMRDDDNEEEDDDGIPKTSLPFHEDNNNNNNQRGRGRRRRHHRRGEIDDINEESSLPSSTHQSARRDAVTLYTSTKPLGKLRLFLSTLSLGAIMGYFIGRSIFNHPLPTSPILALILSLGNLFRSDYGEFTRALGLAFIYSIQRTRRIRKQYPTKPHVKALLGMTPRQPFPPLLHNNDDDTTQVDDNPWKYRPRPDHYYNDPQFTMLSTLLAMAIIGGLCFGDIPLLPTWLGSSIGALLFAYVTTLRNARGDLARTMGTRVVAFLSQLFRINVELDIAIKAGRFGGRILDRILILDRKHRIKDRLGQLGRWTYDRVSKTVSQVQSDMQEQQDEPQKERE